MEAGVIADELEITISPDNTPHNVKYGSQIVKKIPMHPNDVRVNNPENFLESIVTSSSSSVETRFHDTDASRYLTGE